MSSVLHLKPGMQVSYCDYSNEGGYIVLREYKPYSDEVIVDQYEEVFPDSDECCPRCRSSLCRPQGLEAPGHSHGMEWLP